MNYSLLFANWAIVVGKYLKHMKTEAHMTETSEQQKIPLCTSCHKVLGLQLWSFLIPSISVRLVVFCWFNNEWYEPDI